MVPHDRLSRCYGTLLQTLHYLAPATVWFYRLHLLFLLFVGLVGGAIVYAIEGAIEADVPPHHYIDCAFIMTGAVTGGGLQTFDVAPLAGGSQALIFIASLIGGSVFLSAAPATYRRFVIWRAARLALRCTTDKDPRLSGYLSTHLEYRALSWVRALVLIYWATVQITVWLALGTYFAVFPGAAALAVRSGVGPFWFSAFVTVTGFANVGLVPLPDGLAQFSGDYAVLLLLALVIALGNTMYPVALHGLVAAVHASSLGRNDPALQYLLERPRRVHTHLFPPVQTAAVFAANAFLVALQWITYSATNAGLPVYEAYPGHVRSLVSFFQAVTARAAGFTIVDLSTISAAAQLSSFFAMYIPAHPFAVSLSGAMNNADIGPGPFNADVDPNASPVTEAPAQPTSSGRSRRGLPTSSVVFEALRFSPVRRRAMERRMHRLSNDVAPAPAAASVPPRRSPSFSVPDATKSMRQQRSITVSSGGMPPPALQESWTAQGSVASFMAFNVTAILGEASGAGSSSGGVRRHRALQRLYENLMSLIESDVMWLATALFVLSLTERARLFDDPDPVHHFSLFACAFELMSAYATCGISLGYPGDSNSLSRQFTTAGKLVVMAAMIAGKLRGFPHGVNEDAELPAVELFATLPVQACAEQGVEAVAESAVATLPPATPPPPPSLRHAHRTCDPSVDVAAVALGSVADVLPSPDAPSSAMSV